MWEHVVVLFRDADLDFGLHLCRPASGRLSRQPSRLCSVHTLAVHTLARPPWQAGRLAGTSPRPPPLPPTAGNLWRVLPGCWSASQGPSQARPHVRVLFLRNQRVNLEKPAASKEKEQRESEREKNKEMICTGNFFMASALLTSVRAMLFASCK